MTPGEQRWAWAEVDLDAIRHNVAHVASVVAPSGVWAVVKADAYGHGAVDVARAALDAGAGGLCVALVQEGVELREAGIEAPILVLTEQPADQITAEVRHRLTPTVYTLDHVERLAVAAAGAPAPIDVHLMVDTGMQRVGVRPDAAPAVVAAIGAHSGRLRLAGIYTHLATADDPGDPAAADQLDRFDELLATLGADPGLELDAGAAANDRTGVAIHAANSAGALAWPRARRSFVRLGIAMYGISPGPGVDHLAAGLRPALSLRARVSYVKRVTAGSRISYGLRHTFERDTTVATVPIGYADGVPRRLWATGGEVLIGGRRRPIVGVVTMDQLMVDCGDDRIGAPGHGDPATVAIGDEVVLLGAQAGDCVTAEEWAARLDTIGYEVVCGIGARIARVAPGTGPSLHVGMTER